MRLTIREAFHEHSASWGLAQATLNSHQIDIQIWERLTDNPKLGAITDAVLEAFEEALRKDGSGVTFAYRATKTIRRIVRRVTFGSTFVERRKPHERGPIPKQLDGTLSAFYHLLYRPLKLRGKTKAARDNLEINMRHFDRYLGRPATLADLQDDVVGATMQWFIDRGCANRTANKFRDSITALWRFAFRKSKITGVTDWPDVEALPEPIRAPVAWTKPQMQRLWKACASQPGAIGNVPAALWWTGLVAISWDSAERITAIMRLTWGDLDLETGWLHFRAETRKGGRADNLARLHPETLAFLSHFPNRNPERPILPWDRCEATLWTHYKLLLRGVSLPATRERMFHCLRKSAASWFEAAGGNATDLLGHSSRKVTMKYIDPTICQRQQASDVLFRPGAGKAVALIESGK